MDHSSSKDPRLHIDTLGHFSVRYGNEEISTRAQRSTKLWQLFKYLLTHRGKMLAPYSVLDDLWPETENAAPMSALHDLIYRLRKLFSDVASESGEPLIAVEFTRGTYCFYLNNEVVLDVNEFLHLSQGASEIKRQDKEEAINLYLKAIDLYNGDYLSGIYENWLLAPRQHYRRIFISNLQDALKLLSSVEQYERIIEVCEDTFHAESEWLLEAEEVHKYFMESLIRMGRTVEAFNHYQGLSELLEQEVGVTPTVSVQQLQNWIENDRDSNRLQIHSLPALFSERQQASGPLLCEKTEFHMLCHLEERRQERLELPIMLGLFTLTDEQNATSLSAAMAGLKEVLATNLRSGDALTQYNSEQCISLMPAFESEHIELFKKRMENEYQRRFGHLKVFLNIELTPLFGHE